jgi:hypothetical protein
MTKPPNKWGTERLATLSAKPTGGNPYQTRAATQAATNPKAPNQPSRNVSTPPKELQSNKEKASEVGKAIVTLQAGR